MGELETNKELNNEVSLDEDSIVENSETAIIEYKDVEDPCVALTIIGENRLSDAEIFVRRGFRYSIKTFFSAISLTILNLFI